MTLLELVTHLRQNILYDTGGTGVNWQDYSEDDYDSIQLRWTNEELVANINEAIRQVYRRTNPVTDIYEIKLKVDKSDYTLDSYVRKVIDVRRESGRKLEERSFHDFAEDDFLTRTGEPRFFIPDDKTNILKIYPIPTAVETLRAVIYRFPKANLDWTDYDSSPELKEEYQLPMLFYAASLCYLKDEVNTIDPNRAGTFAGLFNMEFPPVSAYSNIRKSKTTNRPVKFGGY